MCGSFGESFGKIIIKTSLVNGLIVGDGKEFGSLTIKQHPLLRSQSTHPKSKKEFVKSNHQQSSTTITINIAHHTP